MKIYEFGDKNKPSIMLFPGTCCYWKTNFGHVLDGLQEHFHTLVVSYSGFDDTENSTFISELDEVLKVENYIKDKLDGKLFFKAVADGCGVAEAVLDEYIKYLAVGLSGIVNIFDPDMIVLSGGITNVGDMLLTPLKSAMNSDTEITVSKLKGDAGTIGAALLIV